MRTYVLAISGIIAAGSLLSLMLPEGQTKKYVKGILSLIILYVVISPLPKLLSSDFDIKNVIGADYTEYSSDEDFLDGISANSFKTREKLLADYLSGKGVKATVRFVGKTGNAKEIDYVNVILAREAFTADKSNSIDIDEIRKSAAAFSGVAEEDIRVFYERR